MIQETGDTTGNDPSDEALRSALGDLNHDDDGDWTQKGEPGLAAVRKLNDGVYASRSEIERIAPGYRRSDDFMPAPEDESEASARTEPEPEALAEPEPLVEPEARVEPEVSHEPPNEPTLAEKMVALKAHAEGLSGMIQEATDERHRVMAAIDKLTLEQEGAAPSPAEEYSAYLEAQTRHRTAVARRSQAISEAVGIRTPGIDAKHQGSRSSLRHRQQSGAVGLRSRGVAVPRPPKG